MIPPLAAEEDGPAALEIGGHDDEPLAQLPEVVAPALDAEGPLEVAPDRFVVEEADRQRPRHLGQRFEERLLLGAAPELEHGVGEEPREHEAPLGPLAVVRREEGLGHEGVLAGLVLDQGADHLHRGQVVGERRGDERPGAHADVDVEFVEIEAVERLIEGPERADFVHGALRAAAGQREADPAAFAAAPCLGGHGATLYLAARRVAFLAGRRLAVWTVRVSSSTRRVSARISLRVGMPSLLRAVATP